jgi:diadenosine tetraphosphate (Ap4A) HIT family hydrolase
MKSPILLIKIIILITFCFTTSISVAQENVLSGVEGCTQAPDLLGGWKIRVLGSGATDAAIREHVERQRNRIERKRDPFTPLFCSDDDELQAKGEVILWKDSRVMVLVNKFNRLKALVIPRKDTTFPIDASPDLLQELSKVAATTSDAFTWTANNSCDPTFSQILINPPARLMISQLHVHVVPPISAGSVGDISDFHRRVSEFLKKSLGSGVPPECP